MNIKYLKGDATKPTGKGKKIIIHCCNDIGAWGAGFVLAISKKWKDPENKYKKWYNSNKLHNTETNDFNLGEVQFVKVEKDIWVANMIGQKGVGFSFEDPPVKYEAIRKCLKKVAKECLEKGLSVHAPKFGAGLAGGDWKKIESIITEELIANKIDVTIYEL